MTNATAHLDGWPAQAYPGVEALTDLTLEVPGGSISGFLEPTAREVETLELLAA